jgi:hypothetical protein
MIVWTCTSNGIMLMNIRNGDGDTQAWFSLLNISGYKVQNIPVFQHL